MHRIVGYARRGTLAGILVLSAAMALFGCTTKETENEVDACEATKKATIEPMFRFYFRVTETGGAPYTGAIDFRSEKHYCDGTVKGIFTDHIDATTDGFWKPITTQYKLANEKDFVLVVFMAKGSEFGWQYGYERVASEMVLEDFTTWVFEDTIDVTVPE